MIGFKSKERGKTARWVAEMERQARERALVHSTPQAYVLDIVDNGAEHGWKWLCWDYDPDQKRLMAGGVEGVVVPHGMQGGFTTREEAMGAGLDAIAKTWTGDVVLRGWA